MDEIDLRIAKVLAHDGRAGNSLIARRLGISEGTVRQRLKRLVASGKLRVQALVNSDKVASKYLAIIGLNLEGRQLERCAERINRLPEVQQTFIVTGRYDILITVLLDSHGQLVDFVTHELSKIPGIRDSETFVCLKNYDPWFPASRLDGPTIGRATPKRRASSRQERAGQ